METSTQLENGQPFKGRIKPGEKRNPKGAGGFQDRPHDISPGGWKKENSISYQYSRFMHMPEAEFLAWAKLPATERTMAERIAYNRVKAADKSLPDVKEITDRTEGKAKESVDVTSDGKPITFQTINFTDANDNDSV